MAQPQGFSSRQSSDTGELARGWTPASQTEPELWAPHVWGGPVVGAAVAYMKKAAPSLPQAGRAVPKSLSAAHLPPCLHCYLGAPDGAPLRRGLLGQEVS